jgi:hypothetical protein
MYFWLSILQDEPFGRRGSEVDKTLEIYSLLPSSMLHENQRIPSKASARRSSSNIPGLPGIGYKYIPRKKG